MTESKLFVSNGNKYRVVKDSNSQVATIYVSDIMEENYSHLGTIMDIPKLEEVDEEKLKKYLNRMTK